MNKALTETVPVSAELPKSASRVSARQVIVGIVAAVALAVGIVYGIKQWQFYGAHEETDDAQVEGHISPVLPRV